MGKNNRYGHPTAEVLDRLKSKQLEILRTDILGDVVYACAGAKEQCMRENTQ